MPLAIFFTSSDIIIKGILLTVAVTSRIDCMRRSAGAICSVGDIKAQPLSRSVFLNRAKVGREVKPLMLSSLSNVPPAWYCILSQIMGT